VHIAQLFQQLTRLVCSCGWVHSPLHLDILCVLDYLLMFPLSCIICACILYYCDMV